MAEDRSTKAYKGLSQKETREKLIRDRAARLARDAEKQGITPAQLAKKKRDTYVKVVGGAASLLPIGKIISLASKGAKVLKASAKAAKVSKAAGKATKSKTPAAKSGARAKSKSTAVTVGSKTKTPAAKAGARAKSQSGRAAKKPTSKKTPTIITALRNNPRAKRAILGGAVTSATLATIDDIRKSGKGKAVAAPTSRPKRPTKRTGMSEGNTVAGLLGKKKALPKAAPTKPKGGESKAKTKARDLTLRDKGGVRSKTRLPAGAKPFKGNYNSKTEKLKNIGGKTYVVKR